MTQSDLLKPLVDAIETVKRRIENETLRPVLAAQEAQTRVSLVDPILIALGWDVGNPVYVRSEFSVDNRRADYALLADAKSGDAKQDVAVSIEAKSLDTNLGNRNIRDQMTLQVNDNGATHAVLTDGNTWLVYDFRRTGQRVEEKLFLAVKLSQEETHESALKLLLLWRPNIASETPVEAGRPLVGELGKADKPPIPEPSPAPDPPSDKWMTLSKFAEAPGSKVPLQIRFPNGESVEPRTWRAVMGETLAWLDRNGGLSFPVLNQRGFVLATLGRSRPDDRQYASAARAATTDIYFEGNANGKELCRRAAAVVTIAKKSPDEFLVLPSS